MTSIFQNAAVFIKPTGMNPEDLERLIALLESEGLTVWLCERGAALLKGRRPGYTRDRLGELCDLAVVLGGDGTMLGVARDLAAYNRPIIGINAGRLGFITDLMLSNMHEGLPKMLAGEYIVDQRFLLEADVVRDDKVVYHHVAVNDIGFSNGRVGGVIEVIISVNGNPMSCQLADGIICSSTTGSTAYALAAGGPLLHPSLDGMCIVPVAAHTLSNRPIVVPSDAKIEIELLDCREAVAYYDMQEFFDARPGDRLKIRRSEHTITMLHAQGYDYFDLLRRKLKWNYMPANTANGSCLDNEDKR